jgi:hypothetical protein
MKIKEAGRPPGAANKRSAFVRNHKYQGRCTEGFIKTVQALIGAGIYKTPADVIHEAVQLLANKKLTTAKDRYWITQIQ